jgi:hypothetical protein
MLPDANATPVEMELWKMARMAYEKKLEVRNRNSSLAYAITLGQCSQALQNQIKAHTNWHEVNTTSDIISLLRLVQTCMTQGQT